MVPQQRVFFHKHLPIFTVLTVRTRVLSLLAHITGHQSRLTTAAGNRQKSHPVEVPQIEKFHLQKLTPCPPPTISDQLLSKPDCFNMLRGSIAIFNEPQIIKKVANQNGETKFSYWYFHFRSAGSGHFRRNRARGSVTSTRSSGSDKTLTSETTHESYRTRSQERHRSRSRERSLSQDGTLTREKSKDRPRDHSNERNLRNGGTSREYSQENEMSEYSLELQVRMSS